MSVGIQDFWLFVGRGCSTARGTGAKEHQKQLRDTKQYLSVEKMGVGGDLISGKHISYLDKKEIQ